jgi:hypothetical protein
MIVSLNSQIPDHDCIRQKPMLASMKVKKVKVIFIALLIGILKGSDIQ